MAHENTHILVIDDDRRLRTLLEKFLTEHPYYVTTAANVIEARALMQKYMFDILIVDIMMPGETGIEFTQALRAKHVDTPILMLTAMGEADDRIKGLQSGVDDYLCKPFEPKELVLRLEAILKRYHTNYTSQGSQIVFGHLQYHVKTNCLEDMDTDEIVTLTTAEQSILTYLLRHTNVIVTRQQLIEHLNKANNTDLNERSIDVHINRLRQRIEQNPKKPLYLQTVRGEGYKLVLED